MSETNTLAVPELKSFHDEQSEEIEKLKAENEKLRMNRSAMRCGECGNTGMYSSGIQYFGELNDKVTKLTRKLEIYKAAIDKIALGESQFDNVDHMYTARQAIQEAEGVG